MSDAAARRARLDALFDQALDLEGEARERFVDGLPPDDARALRGLLEAAQATGAGIGVDPALAQRLIGAVLGDDVAGEPGLPFAVDAWLCTREIGSGGMGRVLLAERREAGFEQRGALKLIRDEYATGEFARRFVQERRILARLDHPGIARLLDGGVDARGRQYLVMEYVDGEPIDRWCDARAADVDTRIARFVEACEAVAFAHRQLVVHRDIKPSNIVVDADGRVRLLDFGIAKVLDTTTAPGDQTRAELRLFTPEYATPEQVRGEPVGVATDVYQLGLLLYELLCGHRAQRIQGSGALAVERAVCLDDPPRPSQRVGPEDAARASARATTPAGLRRRLRGDLDTLVMAALRKEPDRRYPTVAALLDDVQRWRAGLPLRASDDGALRRAAKFVRRHPFGVAASVVFVLLLSGYAATVTWQARALERERDRAQAEASKALQVQGLLQRLFEGIDPEATGGERLTVEELLDRGFAEIDQRTDLAAEVRVELLDTVGNVYRGVGKPLRAAELLERAAALMEPLEAERPQLAARVLRSLGRALAEGNDLERARSMLDQSIELQRGIGSAGDQELARTLVFSAEMHMRRGSQDEAEAQLGEALSILRRRHPGPHADVAEVFSLFGDLEHVRGRSEAAESYWQQALAMRREVLPPSHPAIADVQASVALAQSDLGRNEESIRNYDEAIEAMRGSRGAVSQSLGVALLGYGVQLRKDGRMVDAEAAFREALAIQRTLFGDRHARVALAFNELGVLMVETKRYAEAREFMIKAIGALPDSHAGWRPKYLQTLGVVETRRGDWAEASERFLQALAELPAIDANRERRARILRLRSGAESMLGHSKAGLALLREAMAEAQQAGQGGTTEYVTAGILLVEALDASGDRATAARMTQELQRAAESLPVDSPLVARLQVQCRQFAPLCAAGSRDDSQP